MTTIIHANDRQTFDREVLHSPVPVLVDFWATWCGPCLQVAPEIETLAAAYGDDLRVVKVDVDLNSGVAADYSIQTIPTIGLFKSGQLVAQTHGAKRARVIEGDLGLPTSIEVGA
jgi:thioredoxin 1